MLPRRASQHHVPFHASPESMSSLCERLRPYLPQFAGPVPGSDAEASPLCKGERAISPFLRCYHYRCGHFSAPHYDKSFTEHEKQRQQRQQREGGKVEKTGRGALLRFSARSVLLYLNEDFEGGETTFFAEGHGLPLSRSGLTAAATAAGGGGGAVEIGEEARRSLEKSVVARVRPRTGDVLVFPHGRAVPGLFPDPFHEGSIVSRGRKCIIRTDLVFSYRKGSGRRGSTKGSSKGNSHSHSHSNNVGRVGEEEEGEGLGGGFEDGSVKKEDIGLVESAVAAVLRNIFEGTEGKGEGGGGGKGGRIGPNNNNNNNNNNKKNDDWMKLAESSVTKSTEKYAKSRASDFECRAFATAFWAAFKTQRKTEKEKEKEKERGATGKGGKEGAEGDGEVEVEVEGARGGGEHKEPKELKSKQSGGKKRKRGGSKPPRQSRQKPAVALPGREERVELADFLSLSAAALRRELIERGGGFWTVAWNARGHRHVLLASRPRIDRLAAMGKRPCDAACGRLVAVAVAAPSEGEAGVGGRGGGSTEAASAPAAPAEATTKPLYCAVCCSELEDTKLKHT